MNKNILTIATGKKLYVDMAVNLANSFLYWHPNSDIKFQLVTDLPHLLPVSLASKIQTIIVKEGELGYGFSPKLHLDKLASEGQTLFIDSDCLIFGNLNGVFELFKGHPVSVVGKYVSDGEWFGNVADICRQFKIPHYPQFNGGLYYLENGREAAAVYETARSLEKKYDEIGFVRLRNRPNDEVLMALAMQLNNQFPVIDDSSIMSDPQACPGKYKLDVINGKRLLINPPAPHPLHQNWYPFTNVSPLIVHFLGYYTKQYPYKKESYRLQKALSGKLNLFTEIKALLTIEYPSIVSENLKNTFRPVYRMVAGYRKIKVSERI